MEILVSLLLVTTVARSDSDRETALYPPVKQLFEIRGFRVRAEVAGCDLYAEGSTGLVAVELKKRLSLRLLEQAVERQQVADVVYIAVPNRAIAQRVGRRRRQERLLRRLGVGLITVAAGGVAQFVFHPDDFVPRKSSKRRDAVRSELQRRSIDGNVGGSTGTVTLTAYREDALFLACLLRRLGPSAPRDLVKLGGAKQAATVLRNNHYGWFLRVRRGVYDLTEAGKAVLKHDYAELVSILDRRAAEITELPNTTGSAEGE